MPPRDAQAARRAASWRFRLRPHDAPCAPLIFDPQPLPVVGTDDHLPAVPAGAPDAAALRAALRRAARLAARDRAATAALLDALAARTPSVLVPLVAARRRPDRAADAAHRRTCATTPARSAFPAAAPKPTTPTRSPPRCARPRKRSACAPRSVEVIGALPIYTTVTGFVVTPVVGLVRARLRRCSSTPSRWPRPSRCRWRS